MSYATTPANLHSLNRIKGFGGIGAPLGLLLLLLIRPSAAAAQNAPSVGPLATQPFIHMTGDILGYDLVPSFNGTFKGVPFRTNRWGMHDKEYSLVAPARTYRIALLGSSFTMAGGVPQEKSLEALVEDRLNREATTPAHRHYEILNFSVGGYGVLHNVAVAEKKVFPFAPNAVFLIIHSIEPRRIATSLIEMLRKGVPIPYPELRQQLQKAGVKSGMEEPELRRRLAPIAPDIVRWGYRRIAQLCRQHGVPLVGIVFPEPRDGTEQLDATAALASEAGVTLLKLNGVYTGHPYESVQLPGGDFHLNELGHQLVADRLYQLLRAGEPQSLKLGIPVQH